MAYIRIYCPKCQASFKISNKHIGKKGRCQKCGKRFVISAPEESKKTASGGPESQVEATQPAGPKTAQPIEATVKQDASLGSIETMPAPKESQAGNNIAATIAAPAEKDAAQIKAAEQDVPVEWEEGQTILDLYEVKHVYRTGGMGLVYKVHHKNWNMDLAVKSPRADFFKTEAQKEDFMRECETWVDLDLHPNIVSCYYVRTLGGIPRVFAEYVGGGSLKDWIDNKKLYEGGKKKALERILDIAIQFAWGLQYSHEKDLVHQDVKPANVMMTEDGTAKVTDFGLAKARAVAGETAAGDAQQSILVSSGGMTPAYCSPEQANKQSLSRKTDIWSWGLSVLEMFAGEVFWRDGQAAPEALESFIEMGTEDESIPKMPDGLVELLKQCFQRNPDDRPKDMQEVACRLREIYQQVTNGEYTRPEPKHAELLADSLNNKAVSMLDLEKKEEAEKLYEEALKADPHHPEATYNRGLLWWRSGRMTDVEIVRQLEEVRTTHQDDWKDEYLLGLVHTERGDFKSAVKVLQEVAEQAPKEPDVQTALKIAELSLNKYANTFHRRTIGGKVGFFSDYNGHLSPLWMSNDGLGVLDVATGQFKRILVEEHFLALSRNGRFALSRRGEGSIGLWDVSGGRCLRTFTGPRAEFARFLSDDGCLAIFQSKDGHTFLVWDINKDICLKSLEINTTLAFCNNSEHPVEFSPNGRCLALARTKDRTFKLWDISTCRHLQTFRGPEEGLVSSFAISNDGHHVLSGQEYPFEPKLWDVATGVCLQTFKGHIEPVTVVALSPKGDFAVSGSEDNTLRLWELKSGMCLQTFKCPNYTIPRDIAISPDGQLALSALYHLFHRESEEKFLAIWHITCGKEQRPRLCQPRSFSVLHDNAYRVRSLKEEATAAIESGDARKAYKAVLNAKLIPGYSMDVELLTIEKRAGLLGRASNFGVGWSHQTFKGHTRPVRTVALCSDGRLAVSGGDDKTVKIWDITTGTCLRNLAGHEDKVTSVAFSPCGNFVLSGSPDKSIRLWNVCTGECIHIFDGCNILVNSTAFSPDGRLAFSASGLWDIMSGNCLRRIGREMTREIDYMLCTTLSPDGRLMLLSGEKGLNQEVLVFLDIAGGQSLCSFGDKDGSANSVAFSPDGRYILSTHHAEKSNLKLRKTVTGECLWTVEAHLGSARSSAFSPDGCFAISGGDDKTVKLWNVATGKCLRIFEGHMNRVWSVAFSLDGCLALSGSEDNTLRLWRLVWNYEFPEVSDWDEGAKSYLEIFLTLHCPYGEDRISRVGKPVWNDEDFKKLLKDLQYHGYGWLRPEGVRKKLEEMTANWQGPPPLPGEK